MRPIQIMMLPLTDRHDARFEPLLRIYRISIPERERKPEDDIRAMAGSPRHHVLVAAEGPTVLGFCIAYSGEVALLEYLASDEAARGRGIGSSLYQAIRAATCGRPLLVEVESDRVSAPDVAIRARRIAFYRRLGCRRVAGLDFILPLPGAGAPPPLDLLVDDGRRATVSRDELGSWLTEIYVGVYGCRADDPRLELMLEALPEQVPLD